MPDQKLPLATMEEVQERRGGDDCEQIKVMTLDDRKTAWVRENKIAGFVELGEGGPSRIIFIGGGYLDVCGNAEIFRREARIIELQREKRNASA